MDALRRMMHLNRQLLTRAMGDKGGHPAQAACMWALSAHEGLSQRDLAEHLHLAPPTVTVMLQKMEKAGVIERHPDENDQRLTRIGFTEKGRALGRELHAARTGYLQATIGAMSEVDRNELARLLGVLADNTARALQGFEHDPAL
jgi:DNA-binding MarR family transcriptional regulator